MFTPLRIANKLAIICCTFSLPIAVLLFLMISGINNDIQFARMEVHGNQYQRALEKLLQHLSEHKQANYVLSSGDLGAQSQIAHLAQQLDADFKALKQVDQALGENLQTTAAGLAQRKRQHLRPETMQQEWGQLKSAAPGVAERDKLHDHLIADVRGLITHIGDTSNLILDPDLDSYYLMDITLLKLPSIQDRLQEVLAYGQQILAQKNISPEQQTQLQIYAALLKQSDLDHIIADVKTALNEDPNFYGTSDSLQKNLSPALLKEIATHIDGFIQHNKRLAVAGPAAVRLSAYQDSAQQALLSSYRLWGIAATELDVLLEVRIRYYQHTRLMALLLTLFALFTAILMAFLIIVRGILRPMRGQFNSISVELEQQVAQRTAQLETSNKELDAFCYSVSHDLKAPLRGITGYAQELELRHKEGLTERAQFCITQIITAARNLDSLIEDLLKYSRLDAETLTLTEVRLLDLIQSILHDRSYTLTKMGVVVSINVPPLTLTTWERGLHQILTNLIDNAIKYSRNAKPPRLTISAEAVGSCCLVTVADNGIGFDMKYHDRIYGLFNRLVRASEFEGTGVGLAIVKKLTEKLGGSIRAEATLSQGATFFVELPNSSAPTSASPTFSAKELTP